MYNINVSFLNILSKFRMLDEQKFASAAEVQSDVFSVAAASIVFL